jgi:hypothetical protein
VRLAARKPLETHVRTCGSSRASEWIRVKKLELGYPHCSSELDFSRLSSVPLLALEYCKVEAGGRRGTALPPEALNVPIRIARGAHRVRPAG